jgi:hypothetical protein
LICIQNKGDASFIAFIFCELWDYVPTLLLILILTSQPMAGIHTERNSYVPLLFCCSNFIVPTFLLLINCLFVFSPLPVMCCCFCVCRDINQKSRLVILGGTDVSTLFPTTYGSGGSSGSSGSSHGRYKYQSVGTELSGMDEEDEGEEEQEEDEGRRDEMNTSEDDVKTEDVPIAGVGNEEGKRLLGPSAKSAAAAAAAGAASSSPSRSQRVPGSKKGADKCHRRTHSWGGGSGTGTASGTSAAAPAPGGSSSAGDNKAHSGGGSGSGGGGVGSFSGTIFSVMSGGMLGGVVGMQKVPSTSSADSGGGGNRSRGASAEQVAAAAAQPLAIVAKNTAGKVGSYDRYVT